MDVTAQTDEEIVRALAAGDRAALAQVFDRHAAAMTRYVWAIVDDRHDVEEVVQDAFLLLWQRAGTLELPAESLLPWLLVVCRNLARNAGRKRSRHRADELPETLAAPPSTPTRSRRCGGSGPRSRPCPSSTDGSASSACSRGARTPRPRRRSA